MKEPDGGEGRCRRLVGSGGEGRCGTLRDHVNECLERFVKR